MRRSDREVIDFNEIKSIIAQCDVCRIALNDIDYPYILPLNFGEEIVNGKVILYFHGALEGKKYDLIAKDPKACFEMDCNHKLLSNEEKGNCTMEYESVIGKGKITILESDEKKRGLDILMKHYHKDGFPYNQAVIPQTIVFKMEVESLKAKRRVVKGQY